jgi:hypothetical protein
VPTVESNYAIQGVRDNRGEQEVVDYDNYGHDFKGGSRNYTLDYITNKIHRRRSTNPTPPTNGSLRVWGVRDLAPYNDFKLLTAVGMGPWRSPPPSATTTTTFNTTRMVMGRAPGRLVIAFYIKHMYVKHSVRAKKKSGRRGAKFFFLLHLHLHFFFLLFFIFSLTSSPILPLKSIEFLAVGGLEPLARP